jgi:hypothetical protein
MEFVTPGRLDARCDRGALRPRSLTRPLLLFASAMAASTRSSHDKAVVDKLRSPKTAVPGEWRRTRAWVLGRGCGPGCRRMSGCHKSTLHGRAAMVAVANSPSPRSGKPNICAKIKRSARASGFPCTFGWDQAGDDEVGSAPSWAQSDAATAMSGETLRNVGLTAKRIATPGSCLPSSTLTSISVIDSTLRFLELQPASTSALTSPGWCYRPKRRGGWRDVDWTGRSTLTSLPHDLPAANSFARREQPRG